MRDMNPQPPRLTPEEQERQRKRNRVLGLALGAFVVALGVISYFRIKGLTP